MVVFYRPVAVRTDIRRKFLNAIHSPAWNCFDGTLYKFLFLDCVAPILHRHGQIIRSQMPAEAVPVTAAHLNIFARPPPNQYTRHISSRIIRHHILAVIHR